MDQNEKIVDHLMKNPQDASLIETAIQSNPDAVVAIEQAIAESPRAMRAIERAINTNPKAMEAIKVAISNSPEATDAIRKAINASPTASGAIKDAINKDAYARSEIEHAINDAGEKTLQLIQSAIENNPDALKLMNDMMSGTQRSATTSGSFAAATSSEFVTNNAAKVAKDVRVGPEAVSHVVKGN